MTQKGRVVVTGASSGIGLAICRVLAADGYTVTGVARDFSTEATAVLSRAVSFDLSSAGELDDFARRLAAEEKDADAVVLAAGAGAFAPVESLSVAQIRRMLDLNLLAPMIISRAFVPGFKSRRRGDLVFIGSEASRQAGPRGTAYCASKFGLRGYVKALRIECASRGVRVSLVNPGMTDTAFYDGLDFRPGAEPAQHLRADDVAEAVRMILAADPAAVFEEIDLAPLVRVIDFSRRSTD